MRGDYGYFKEAPHEPDHMAMDEFNAEAMRTDIKSPTLAEEVHFPQHPRITLGNEWLACYEYLRQKGLLERYHAYRHGEELPFD